MVLGQRALFWTDSVNVPETGCVSVEKNSKICSYKQLFSVLTLSPPPRTSLASSGGALEELQQEWRIFSKPWDRPVHVIHDQATLIYLFIIWEQMGIRRVNINQESNQGGGTRWVTAIRAVNPGFFEASLVSKHDFWFEKLLMLAAFVRILRNYMKILQVWKVSRSQTAVRPSDQVQQRQQSESSLTQCFGSVLISTVFLSVCVCV